MYLLCKPLASFEPGFYGRVEDIGAVQIRDHLDNGKLHSCEVFIGACFRQYRTSKFCGRGRLS